MPREARIKIIEGHLNLLQKTKGYIQNSVIKWCVGGDYNITNLNELNNISLTRLYGYTSALVDSISADVFFKQPF